MEHRNSMMAYFAYWRDTVANGRVFLTGNFNDLQQMRSIRNVQEELLEQNFSVFLPCELIADPGELNYGERGSLLSIVVRAIENADFIMCANNSNLVGDYLLHLGVAHNKGKPIVTMGEQLTKPYDTLPMLHLSNETEISKFFETMKFKSAISSFGTRITAVAGYFHTSRD